MTLTNNQIVKIKKQFIWLIVFATTARLFLASQVELANDEVYYWTYALYPDLSHFDHPPLVGFLAQIFSLNLLLKDDFFLRLGSIVLSTGSTWIIFLIGRKIKNELAGLYAAFLYTSSIYCSIISGFSLIPDAPQVFFWLLSLNLALEVLPVERIENSHRKKMLLIGVVAGLAMLSKYHSVFIWVGILLFVLFQNRKWLLDYSLYLSGIISLLVFSPVLIWNIQNKFISFTFHGDRVSPALELRPDYFFTEMGGQIAYNNPLNVILIVIALVALFKGKEFIDAKYKWVLLLNAIPLWLLFTGFSLFRSTLPHWSGPAFLSLILIAAAYWAERIGEQNLPDKKIIRPLRIVLPSYLLVFLLVTAFYIINYSPFTLGKQNEIKNFGEYDFTQDMYGYDQVNGAFKEISQREESSGSMAKGSALISNKWFPGAHLDFYVARPTNRNLFLIGNLNEIHKYAWINKQRGGLQKGKDYYHIAVSNYYNDPTETFGNYFEKVEPMDTVKITRGGAVMRYAFFYRLKNYKGNFSEKIN
ncbi:MAG: ArnT family glycosyltransferase [Cyclobacteriaceae bacterium]